MKKVFLFLFLAAIFLVLIRGAPIKNEEKGKIFPVYNTQIGASIELIDLYATAVITSNLESGGGILTKKCNLVRLNILHANTPANLESGGGVRAEETVLC